MTSKAHNGPYLCIERLFFFQNVFSNWLWTIWNVSMLNKKHISNGLNCSLICLSCRIKYIYRLISMSYTVSYSLCVAFTLLYFINYGFTFGFFFSLHQMKNVWNKWIVNDIFFFILVRSLNVPLWCSCY